MAGLSKKRKKELTGLLEHYGWVTIEDLPKVLETITIAGDGFRIDALDTKGTYRISILEEGSYAPIGVASDMAMAYEQILDRAAEKVS